MPMKKICSDPVFIFRGIDAEKLISASRAAKWMNERPDQKDAILSYKYPDGTELALYAKRNKSSITIRKLD